MLQDSIHLSESKQNTATLIVHYLSQVICKQTANYKSHCYRCGN